MEILEKHMCCTLGSILLLVLLETVPSMGYARYEGCIFGSAESCFFDCNCKDNLCNRTTGIYICYVEVEILYRLQLVQQICTSCSLYKLPVLSIEQCILINLYFEINKTIKVNL